MKKMLGSLLLSATVFFGVSSVSQATPTPASTQHHSSSTNQTPHNLKVQKLIKQRVHRAFQLAGRRDSLVIQCHIVPPTQASSLRNASRAYFQSMGQDVSDFDREYSLGFQEGIIMFKTKSPHQQKLLCTRLEHT